MDNILLIDYIKELILDNITYVELNNMRCCSKDLQKIVSEYSEYKMTPYLNMINHRVKYLKTPKLRHYLELPYIILYNYYHEIIKYSYLLIHPDTNTSFQNMKRTLKTKKVTHHGYPFNYDGNYFKKLDKVDLYSYTLFDIMCYIYLTNKGEFWAKDVLRTEEELHEMKFLQGELLPLS